MQQQHVPEHIFFHTNLLNKMRAISCLLAFILRNFRFKNCLLNLQYLEKYSKKLYKNQFKQVLHLIGGYLKYKM